MQMKEQSMDYPFFKIANFKESLDAKERQSLQKFEEKQRRKIYINGQAKKLKKLSNYVRDLGVFKDILLPTTALKAHSVPQQIIQRLNDKDVIKFSQIRYQRMVKTGSIKKNWSSEDLSILIWLICKFTQTNNIPIQQAQFHKQCWKMIEKMVVGATADDCLFKWLSFKKQSVTQYTWDKQEEDLLGLLQKKYKSHENRWKIISNELFKRNTNQNKVYRQPKQCREHFNIILDPTIKKGLWSKQEDYMLICAYLKYNCQRRWCQITRFFKNRTENSLKNRFQLLYVRLNITKEVEKEVQIGLLKQFATQLREQILSCSLEDEMIAEADLLRKQALEGYFIISDASKNKTEILGKQAEEQKKLKKEQNQSQNSYTILKSPSKQEKNLNSPLTSAIVQEQNEFKYKSQNSICFKSKQLTNKIIIPQFQYKQNVIQENIFMTPFFPKENGLGQIQNTTSAHFLSFMRDFSVNLI